MSDLCILPPLFRIVKPVGRGSPDKPSLREGFEASWSSINGFRNTNHEASRDWHTEGLGMKLSYSQRNESIVLPVWPWPEGSETSASAGGPR